MAADLIHKGQYEAAREALGDLWQGVGHRPDVKKLPPVVAAEVLLQCGTLSGWIGSARNVPGAQERAKDLISEALRKFKSQGRHAKVSEAQYELGMCYWRLGSYDEARVILEGALGGLGEQDIELKAKVLIRRTLVEIWVGRYHDAWKVLDEAASFFESCGDALKGRWHGQKGLVLRRLATAEGRADYFDKAIIEYTAAIFHYEQARHERYCATNLNNLAFLLYKLGRYRDAHEHLDRAQFIFTRLRDAGNLAQVDETRARVLVAEKRYREADRIIKDIIRTFEQGGESALLADALTVQGVVWARTGADESSVNVLKRAADLGEEAGAFAAAGLALLALIEEHSGGRLLTATEVYNLYRRADRLLKDTQDAEDIARLRGCARVAMRRLAGVNLRDKNFTFFGAVNEFEARVIEEALEETGGSVTRAAKLLGLTHQTLGSMLKTRHKKPGEKRTPPEKRLRSIIKKDD
ncbi:MAG TPA: helix-turn-helix domain-containing protein [Pyrinomonadaceae bacterium]|nr:helix-turn-helix domain-containing protein [Pyrinomonadaceae bacterium]